EYKDGWFNMSEQIAGEIPLGEPGSFNPLGTFDSVIGGSIDIPAFTGCVTSMGEDVSQLVTAMVSGPNNSIVAHNKSLIMPWCEPDNQYSTGHTYCPDYSTDPPTPPPALRPPSDGESLQRANGLNVPKSLTSDLSRGQPRSSEQSVTDIIPPDVWEQVPNVFRKHIRRSLGLTGTS